MNAKEITLQNIKSMDLVAGQSIKGKGLEIYKFRSSVCYFWAYDEGRTFNDDDIDKAIEKINKVGIENCYIYKCTTKLGQRFSVNSRDTFNKEDLKKFDLEKAIKNRFNAFSSVSVALKPELLGYISVSKYKSDLDSQKQLIRDLASLNGVEFYGDEFYDSEYDYEDGVFKLKNNYDYGSVWGDSYYVTAPGEELSFDGRGYYHNSILDDFWNLDDESTSEYFKEIDPDETIALYHRKGKDWEIGYTLNSRDVYITYNKDGMDCYDDSRLVEDEQFYILEYSPNPELLQKFYSWCEDQKRDLEIKSYIFNELRLQDCYGPSDFSYNDNIFNLKIIDNEYGKDMFNAGRYEFAYELFDYVDYKNKTVSVRDAVAIAYETWLEKHISNDKLFGKYKHLQIIKKLLEADSKELVYTQIGVFTSQKSYAFSFKGEEYHFSLAELYSQNPYDFYRNACGSISKRLQERMQHTLLLEKAKRVFVGLDDSYKSGNCKMGTSEWCKRFGIDTSKIGAIRGDEILNLDFSNFTKRAVLQAIQARGA